ncbi:MAG TPA: Gmad2 immunoglobulin-like domain-containing protein [Anaerolineales bacterium]|nr:Gmad2 immunoglobulin-like domain-containing protein [Anaerolineales bacterium]
MKHIFSFLFWFSLPMLACSISAAPVVQNTPAFPLDTPSPPQITTPPVEVTSTPLPDFAVRARRAPYQLGLTDSLRVVQLTDGKYEEGTPESAEYISVRMTDFVARGDLNADGVDEVAALVSENYGGTGVFVFLAVFSEMNGSLVFQTSTLVDDRPQINALAIANGEIFLDAIIHGFDDPMCCPTLRTTRHYRFTDNQLNMTDYTTFTPDGRPRTITIESPVNGAEVFKSVQLKGRVAIAPFENNLVYRIYDMGGVLLSEGYITVTAEEPGASGTFDAFIPLGNVLSNALIRLEVQDISAADGSLFAMDSVELVVK